MNIFEDPELREALKQYSNWPTYPQLYVNGELIGGSDIIIEMYKSGELQKLVQLAKSAADSDRDAAACRASVRQSGSARHHSSPNRLHTLQNSSAVRCASYAAECASFESQAMPAACSALPSTVWP